MTTSAPKFEEAFALYEERIASLRQKLEEADHLAQQERSAATRAEVQHDMLAKAAGQVQAALVDAQDEAFGRDTDYREAIFGDVVDRAVVALRAALADQRRSADALEAPIAERRRRHVAALTDLLFRRIISIHNPPRRPNK